MMRDIQQHAYNMPERTQQRDVVWKYFFFIFKSFYKNLFSIYCITENRNRFFILMSSTLGGIMNVWVP